MPADAIGWGIGGGGLAHHWQRLLDEQRAANVAEIAETEGVEVT